MICASLAMLCSCIPRPSFLQLHGVPRWMKAAEIHECRVLMSMSMTSFWTWQVWDTTIKAPWDVKWSTIMHQYLRDVSRRLLFWFWHKCLDGLDDICFLSAWRCSSFFFSDCHVVTDFEGNGLRCFFLFLSLWVFHTHWLGWVLRKRTKIPFRRCGRPHDFWDTCVTCATRCAIQDVFFADCRKYFMQWNTSIAKLTWTKWPCRTMVQQWK